MSECNHRSDQSCLHGDECAQCLRDAVATCRKALFAAKDALGEVDLHHGVSFSGTTDAQVRAAIEKINKSLESAGPPPKTGHCPTCGVKLIEK